MSGTPGTFIRSADKRPASLLRSGKRLCSFSSNAGQARHDSVGHLFLSRRPIRAGALCVSGFKASRSVRTRPCRPSARPTRPRQAYRPSRRQSRPPCPNLAFPRSAMRSSPAVRFSPPTRTEWRGRTRRPPPRPSIKPPRSQKRSRRSADSAQAGQHEGLHARLRRHRFPDVVETAERDGRRHVATASRHDGGGERAWLSGLCANLHELDEL
jgi:hypothetical protein